MKRITQTFVILSLIVIFHLLFIRLFTIPKHKTIPNYKQNPAKIFIQEQTTTSSLSLAKILNKEMFKQVWNPTAPQLPSYDLSIKLPKVKKLNFPQFDQNLSGKSSPIPSLPLDSSKIVLSSNALWKINKEITNESLLLEKQLQLIKKNITASSQISSTIIKVVKNKEKHIFLVTKTSKKQFLDLQALQAIVSRYQTSLLEGKENTFEFIWNNILK